MDLLGGETAEMPRMYDDGKYDLAGFCTGIVEEFDVVDGRLIKPGDKVIGIENAKMVIKAAMSTGLPVWIGYSAMMSEDGKSVQAWYWKNALPTSDFDELVEAIAPLGGEIGRAHV